LPYGVGHAWTSYEDNISVGSSGSESSEREYAEGLGCADSKACMKRATSGFEFDRHPREEYFEEPQSHPSAVDSDDERPDWSDHGVFRPFRKRARLRSPLREGDETSQSAQSLNMVLSQLEREEQNRHQQNREAAVQRQLSVVSRRCARRTAARNRCAQNSGDSVPPPNLENRLLTISNDLGRLRAAVSIESRQGEVLQKLQDLEILCVNVAALKSSGIGLELNRKFWRHHPSREIAERSAALVRCWRTAAQAELRQHPSQVGGA